MNEQITGPNPPAEENLQPSPDLIPSIEDEFGTLRSENERLKNEVRINDARQQLTSELIKIGARSPQLMFEAVKGDLRFAADESLENMTVLIEELLARFPEQFGRRSFGSIDGGAGRNAAPQLTAEALAKMTPKEIAALDWNEVKSVLSGGR